MTTQSDSSWSEYLDGIAHAPAPVRSVMGLLSRLSPSLAARLAAYLFSRPQRAKVRPHEIESVAESNRLRVDVDGISLSGHVWGEGPTVLCIHGWGSRGSRFSSLVTPLNEAEFRVIAWDAPAHGDSAGRVTNVPTIARALRKMESHVGPIYGIVAHSLGCWVAALALQDGLSAQRAVFISPPGDLEFFSRAFVETLGFTDEIHDRMAILFERRTGIPWSRFQAEILASGQRTPLLVIHDEEDRTVPIEQARTLVEAWPGASLLLTRGLGHRQILQDETVASAVTNFLSVVP